MALQEEIQQILAQKDITPLDAFNKSRALLRPACAKGGECDPLGANAEQGQYAYMAVANSLERNGFFAASESLLLEWWNDFGLRQREEKQRVN